MSDEDLLPGNSTPFERALSRSTDVLPTLMPATPSMRGIKLIYPPDSFLPFLVWEYGLGPISGYFADKRELLDEGIAWSRERGTHAAVARALGWINYAADIEVFPVRRRRWNLFMLAMASLPAQEEPDLLQIDELANLSTPMRSRFWRGFRTYDVRAVDYSNTKWGACAWSSYSGRRIRADGAKWSFGRDYQLSHTMTQSELEALGVWVAPAVGGGLTWGNFTWDSSDATWDSDAATVRSVLMTTSTLAKSVWICFRKANNDVIGYRRARVKRGVSPLAGGPYRVGSATYAPVEENPRAIYVEAMTDFGDGYGATAAKWSLVFDASPVDTTKPGLAWAGPGELTTGDEILSTTQTIQFRRTVRERFRILLNF